MITISYENMAVWVYGFSRVSYHWPYWTGLYATKQHDTGASSLGRDIFIYKHIVNGRRLYINGEKHNGNNNILTFVRIITVRVNRYRLRTIVVVRRFIMGGIRDKITLTRLQIKRFSVTVNTDTRTWSQRTRPLVSTIPMHRAYRTFYAVPLKQWFPTQH